MFLFLLGLLLFLTSLFMILIVLVQRGRGGGLSGALGGMGGQSAFGAKAGDTFTRITVVTAIIWILLTMLTIKLYNEPMRDTARQGGGSSITSGDEDDAGAIDVDGETPANGEAGEQPPGDPAPGAADGKGLPEDGQGKAGEEVPEGPATPPPTGDEGQTDPEKSDGFDG